MPGPSEGSRDRGGASRLPSVLPGDESFGEGAGSMLRYAGEVDRTAFLAFLYELATGD